MRTLTLSPLGRFGELAPVVVRAIVGIVMIAHGLDKLTGPGPAGFGQEMLAALGVPLPVFFGYVVTFVELVGGTLLVLGLLSRLAALVLTVDLLVAIALVKVDIGLLSPPAGGVGAELDLALIAGFLTVVLAGPGPLSLDRAFGLEGRTAPAQA